MPVRHGHGVREESARCQLGQPFCRYYLQKNLDQILAMAPGAKREVNLVPDLKQIVIVVTPLKGRLIGKAKVTSERMRSRCFRDSRCDS